VRGLVISHVAKSARSDRPRFRLEFDLVAAPHDPRRFSACRTLCGSWAGFPRRLPELMERNHALATRASGSCATPSASRRPRRSRCWARSPSVPAARLSPARCRRRAAFPGIRCRRPCWRDTASRCRWCTSRRPPRQLVRNRAADLQLEAQFKRLAAALQVESSSSRSPRACPASRKGRGPPNRASPRGSVEGSRAGPRSGAGEQLFRCPQQGARRQSAQSGWSAPPACGTAASWSAMAAQSASMSAASAAKACPPRRQTPGRVGTRANPP